MVNHFGQENIGRNQGKNGDGEVAEVGGEVEDKAV